MKKQLTITNIIIVLLLGQINLPLFIHICSKLHTVSFLSSCGMHEPVPQKHSCCENNKSKDDSAQITNTNENAADHCIVVFSKEHSTEASQTNITNVDAGLNILAFVQTSEIQHSSYSLFTHNFIDTSPTVSPPLFLLDSSFRI